MDPELIARAVSALPALSPTGQTLLAAVDAPNADAAALSGILEQDPALLATALRLANSARFAGLRRVDDSRGAAIRCGLEGLRHVAATTILATLGRGVSRLQVYDISAHALLRHSIATAHFARALARHCGSPHVSAAFVAGLLHDVGKIAIDVVVRSTPALRARLSGDVASQSVEAEARRLSFSHDAVGGALLRYWRLPDHLVAAVERHHGATFAADDALSALVAIADALSQWYGFSTGVSQVIATRALNPQTFAICGLSATSVETIAKLALAELPASVALDTAA